MSFELRFKEQAWAEWQRLDGSLRQQFKHKLIERLENPRVPSALLAASKR
jgi:mRNA interferase RelE/StbE